MLAKTIKWKSSNETIMENVHIRDLGAATELLLASKRMTFPATEVKQSGQRATHGSTQVE